MRTPKFDSIDYGYDRLERIVVQIPQRDIENAIAKLAVQRIVEDGKLDPKTWGRFVRIKEWHDGVGMYSEKYGEVTFTRRVKEEENYGDVQDSTGSGS